MKWHPLWFAECVANPGPFPLLSSNHTALIFKAVFWSDKVCAVLRCVYIRSYFACLNFVHKSVLQCAVKLKHNCQIVGMSDSKVWVQITHNFHVTLTLQVNIKNHDL